jgi:glyoxylase-like metal-dependent hydrolase (beta-lactamase superfamily II)
MSNEQWASLPEQMQFLYMNPPKSKVNKTLEGREELPYCGGIQIIFTPGHTPGHISLYLKQSKTLIAGDAMVVADGVLRKPILQTTLDLKTAIDSLQKFLELDIEKVICYHGGLCNIREKKQIEDLLN